MTARRSVRVATEVELDPTQAFEVFTTETERWFRPGPRRRSRSASRGWPAARASRSSTGGGNPLVVSAGDPSLDHHLDRWTTLLNSFETQAHEQRLLELASVFRDAVSAGDGAFLDAHVADDAVLVFGDRRYPKHEVAATIGGHPSYRDVRLRDPQVVRIGDDVAILTCHASGRRDGLPQPFDNFESAAFVRSAAPGRRPSCRRPP